MRFRAALAPMDTRRRLAWSLSLLLLLSVAILLVLKLSDWRLELSLLLLVAGGSWLLQMIWRRESREAVRRSDEMVRISQRIAHIGSWDWDVVKGGLDCSEEICRIFGIGVAEGPKSYQGYLDLLPPEERDILSGAITELLASAAGMDTYAVEHKLLRPDGSQRFVYEVGELFRDPVGTPLRVVSVVHDITERKEAEGALYFEKRYRALIENLPQRIFLKDANSVYLSCNSSFAKELGLQPGDIFGKSDFDLFPPEVAEKRTEDDARVMAAATAEERDEQRGGEGSWVSKALIPLKDDAGSVHGLLGIVTDITFRKRAEEQLRESEARFRNTFEQAAVGICHLALDGVVIRINRRYCEILGYSQQELLGRTLDESIHPDDLLPERDHATRLLRREIENYSIELRQLRKDGSLVWVNLTKSLLCGENGEPRYITGVVEEITAKLEAQALRRERDLVQAASRAKSQFLAGMSHEIRTPMNAIIGLGRLALQTELTHKQREYLEKICSSGQTLLDIINDILDFSKIEAGRVELEKTDFTLAEVLESISDMFSVKAQEKGIAYRVRLSPQLPKRLLGDPLRLTQVLNNLVGNAVKFTEHGEVVVDVKPVERGSEQLSIRFCVQDTGVGLSQEQIEKIFTPFTQADSSTTRRYGGTGLGLSISSQLVELMGGELRVQSVEGAGSSFYFTVSFGIASEAELQLAEREQELSTLGMLVVDGDPDSRHVLTELLHGLPLSVDFADDVPGALTKLATAAPAAATPFDLLMIEGRTVGGEGIETLCREVAARRTATLPILAMVAEEELEKTRRRGEELGLSCVLPAPVRPSVLLDGIVRALSMTYSRYDREPRPSSFARGSSRGMPRQPVGGGASILLEPEQLAEEAGKLKRLLARNSLDAKRQFAIFRGGIAPGTHVKELKALELCLDKLDFKKARQLLAQFPGLPSDLSAEEREHA